MRSYASMLATTLASAKRSESSPATCALGPRASQKAFWLVRVLRHRSCLGRTCRSPRGRTGLSAGRSRRGSSAKVREAGALRASRSLPRNHRTSSTTPPLRARRPFPSRSPSPTNARAPPSFAREGPLPLWPRPPWRASPWVPPLREPPSRRCGAVSRPDTCSVGLHLRSRALQCAALVAPRSPTSRRVTFPRNLLGGRAPHFVEMRDRLDQTLSRRAEPREADVQEKERERERATEER